MTTGLARNWWVLALRGLAGILFGIGAFVWPDATLVALVLVFGTYVFVDGIFAVVAGISMRRQTHHWWLFILEGAAGMLLGLLTFFSPNTTVLVLLTLIAVWSILTGIFEIATAMHIRTMIANGWLLLLSGVVSIIFGALLIAQPGAGEIAIAWLLGAYALLFGILTLMLAFRLRSMDDTTGSHATGAV